MEIMKEKKLKRGVVRLIHEDNGDVSVYLNKRKIAKHTGATYENIKNEDWIQNAYIWFAIDANRI